MLTEKELAAITSENGILHTLAIASSYGDGYYQQVCGHACDAINVLLARIRELEKYERHSKAISELGDCNACADSKDCPVRPKYGAWVRINCHLYRANKEAPND